MQKAEPGSDYQGRRISLCSLSCTCQLKNSGAGPAELPAHKAPPDAIPAFDLQSVKCSPKPQCRRSHERNKSTHKGRGDEEICNINRVTVLWSIFESRTSVPAWYSEKENCHFLHDYLGVILLFGESSLCSWSCDDNFGTAWNKALDIPLYC